MTGTIDGARQDRAHSVATQPVGEADLFEGAVESLGEKLEAVGAVGGNFRVFANSRHLPHEADRVLAGRQVGFVVLEKPDLCRRAPPFRKVIVEEVGVFSDHPQHPGGAFAVTVEVVDTKDSRRTKVIGKRFVLRAAADDRQLHFTAAALVPPVTVFHDLPFVFGGPLEEFEVDHPVVDAISELHQLVAIGGLDDDMDGLHVEDLKAVDSGFVDGPLVQAQHLLMGQPPHLLGLTDVDAGHPAVDHDVVAENIDGDTGVLRHLVRDPPLEATGLRRLPLVGWNVDSQRDLGSDHHPLWTAPTVAELLDEGEFLERPVELARQEVADGLGPDRDLLTDAAELDDQHEVVTVNRLRGRGVYGTRSLEHLAVLAKPREVVPVVGLEVLGVGEALARQVEVATVLGHRVDVVNAHHVDQLCAGGKVADADPGAGRSHFGDLPCPCSGIG